MFMGTVKRTYSLRGVLKGGSWLAGARAFTIVGNIALMAIIPRLLGSEEFGIWAVITSTTGLLAVFNLGLGLAGRNKLAVLKHNAPEGEEARLFWSMFWFLLVVVIVIALSGLFSFRWVDYNGLFTVKDASLSWMAGNYLIIASLFCLLIIPFYLIDDIPYAYHHFKFIALFQCFYTIIPQLIGVAVAFLVVNKLFVLILCTFMIRLLLSLAFTWFFVAQKGWSFMVPPLGIIWGNIKLLIGPALRFWLITSATLFIFVTDTLFISKEVSVSEAGQYNLLLKIYFTIVTFYSLIMAPMWNFYTDAATMGDWKWVRHAVNKTWIISIGGMIILSFILFPIVRPLVRFWSGVPIQLGSGVILACSVWATASVWKTVLGNFLNGINATRYRTLALVVGALISVPLKIHLIKIWGVMGAPWGTVFSLVPLMLVDTIQSQRIIQRNFAAVKSESLST